MIVLFCGHSNISKNEKLERWLFQVTKELIQQGANLFYLGGYGDFDQMAVCVLKRLKREYPHIERVLVLAYCSTKHGQEGYDGTIYPPPEHVPQRYAIVHRNRWMVEQADAVVAYVAHDWGGAAAVLNRARQKKKVPILLCVPAPAGGGNTMENFEPGNTKGNWEKRKNLFVRLCSAKKNRAEVPRKKRGEAARRTGEVMLYWDSIKIVSGRLVRWESGNRNNRRGGCVTA